MNEINEGAKITKRNDALLDLLELLHPVRSQRARLGAVQPALRITCRCCIASRERERGAIYYQNSEPINENNGWLPACLLVVLALQD